jgi:hypothetical protein
MTDRARVAILHTQPETVLDDYRRLFDLAGGAEALQPNTTTILKDNISWHFPMPGANTTPWQLEGTILALRTAAFGSWTDTARWWRTRRRGDASASIGR